MGFLRLRDYFTEIREADLDVILKQLSQSTSFTPTKVREENEKNMQEVVEAMIRHRYDVVKIFKDILTFNTSDTFQINDLVEYSESTLKTLDLPPKIIVPFLVMIVVSLFTQPNSKTALDRYYVKMKTPVRPDPQQDAEELERSYQQPDRFNDRKLWPNSNLEIQKPTRSDVVGFVLSVAACFGIIALAMLVASIGS